ncbi:hypothetical protein CRUP_027094 [Coryphaenoides rupestris]|nr:hypothetical protein CRUP_027094 [Coryphaenoides rupestris]
MNKKDIFDWGHCTGEECDAGGVQTRTLWCVHTEGWTTHHSHCPQADKPESRRHCFKVCEWHQDLFEWEVSTWGGCFLVPFFSNELRPQPSECVTAQHGVQRRSDCVVSNFAPWSGCSRTCGVGLQHRVRHVLATPVFGGAHCPNLTQTRTCSNASICPLGASEHRYSIRVGSWSECRPPQHKDLVVLSGRMPVDYSATDATPAAKNLVKRYAQASPHSRHHHLHHQQHHQQQHHHHSQNLQGQQQHHHHQHFYDMQPHPSSGRMSWELEVGYQTRQVRCTRSDGNNSMLSHLLLWSLNVKFSLSINGCPPEQVTGVLSRLPTLAKKFSKYWICQARLMERQGNLDVLPMFEEADGEEEIQHESSSVGPDPAPVRAVIQGEKGHSSAVKYKITATPGSLATGTAIAITAGGDLVFTYKTTQRWVGVEGGEGAGGWRAVVEGGGTLAALTGNNAITLGRGNRDLMLSLKDEFPPSCPPQ